MMQRLSGTSQHAKKYEHSNMMSGSEQPNTLHKASELRQPLRHPFESGTAMMVDCLSTSMCQKWIFGVGSSGSTTTSSSKPRVAESRKSMHLPAQPSRSGQFPPLITPHTSSCRNMDNSWHMLQGRPSPSGAPRLHTPNSGLSLTAATNARLHSVQTASFLSLLESGK